MGEADDIWGVRERCNNRHHLLIYVTWLVKLPEWDIRAPIKEAGLEEVLHELYSYDLNLLLARCFKNTMGYQVNMYFYL